MSPRRGPSFSVDSSTASPFSDDTAVRSNAVVIQRWWRGRLTRLRVEHFMLDNYTLQHDNAAAAELAASLRKAREHALKQVRRQGDGSLFPLNMPLQQFSVFGAAIHAYMHFVYRLAYLFLCCFTVTLCALVHNVEGAHPHPHPRGR